MGYTVGRLILSGVAILLFFGVAERVLDRLYLRDGTAIGVLAAILVGSFVNVTLWQSDLLAVRLNVGGALVPLGVAAYVLVRADTAGERLRSLLGAVLVAGAIWLLGRVVTDEYAFPVDVLTLYPAVAALVGYLFGRSRRGAFVSAVLGVLLFDFTHGVYLIANGIPGTVHFGGAGMFDTVILSGVLAVCLAELVGESRERLHRAETAPDGKGRKRCNMAVAVLSILCLCLFTYLFVHWQPQGMLPAWQDASDTAGTDGAYYTLYDAATGEALEYMRRRVYAGDGLVMADNRHYRVDRVDGYAAYCTLLGEQGTALVNGTASAPVAALPGTGLFQSVAIYCTHTDECYVPTSGTESKHGGGDILDVAETMVSVLEAQGIRVMHSDTLHDPHDGNAYQRSRKTAAQLLQGAPAVMIDVHRDGIPDPDYYATELGGEPATQIRIVVGRQNQNSEANIAFAERMKAYYDTACPGLIKSIFLAKGNYNQDLAPHSILLEVGTHTNTLEAAQNGAKAFAEALPQFLGLSGHSDESAASEDGMRDADAGNADTDLYGMGKAIVVLLLMAGIAGGIWYALEKNQGRV